MTSNRGTESRYLRWLSFAILIGIVATIVVVSLVDPYGIYRFVDRGGFNHVKPRLARYQEEIKIVQANARHSQHLLAGNSRVQVGFDPLSQALRATGGAFYNLGVPGSPIDTPRRQIEAIQAAGNKIQTLVLGLEFLDAMEIGTAAIGTDSGATEAAEAKLSSGWAGTLAKQFWRIDALYSLTSLKDSIQTLLIQHDAEAESSTPEGFNPFNEYKKFVRNDGYNLIFQQRARDYTQSFLRKSKGSLGEKYFKNLAAILDAAAKDGSDTRLVIYPYHAQIMALFDVTGLTPFFSDWKIRVLAEVDAARLRHPSLRVSIIDFSGFGDYTCTRIPAPNEKPGVSPWYWEAGHFKKELGDVVLARIMKDSVARSDVANAAGSNHAFGFSLDASTRLNNEARIAREREDCAATYPELFDEVKALVATESKK